MGKPVKSYDDWLQLSDEERREVHHRDWDVYGREGIAIAFMAASRLALSSGRKVLDIGISTYHFGQYILSLTVSQADYRNCPPPLEEMFEGFRVHWSPAQELGTAPAHFSALAGRWRAEQGDYEFEIRWTAAGPEVNGCVRSSGEELQITELMSNNERVFFTAYESGRQIVSEHALESVTPDRCSDLTRTTEYYVRVPSRLETVGSERE
jgi:hypothetical protein